MTQFYINILAELQSNFGLYYTMLSICLSIWRQHLVNLCIKILEFAL